MNTASRHILEDIDNLAVRWRSDGRAIRQIASSPVVNPKQLHSFIRSVPAAYDRGATGARKFHCPDHLMFTRRNLQISAIVSACCVIAAVGWAAGVATDGQSQDEQNRKEIQELMEGMEDAQEKYDAQIRATSLAFMSLKAMFPDPQARALAEAAADGDVKTIEELVSGGLDVDVRGTSNATPLFWALQDIDGFEKLLELGADPNVVYDDGGAIMHWAAMHQDVSFLAAALRHGGNPNLLKGIPPKPPLFSTTLSDTIGKQPSPVALLADAGADLNFVSEDGTTPLISAASGRRYDLALELLGSRPIKGLLF